MNCKTCGFCCTHFDLVIPKDKSGYTRGNLMLKKSGEKCHFLGSDNMCTVHDEPWYKDTICHSFDYGDDMECRVCPGKASADILTKNVVVANPNESCAFTQDLLVLLHREMLEKNKATRSRLTKDEM